MAVLAEIISTVHATQVTCIEVCLLVTSITGMIMTDTGQKEDGHSENGSDELLILSSSTGHSFMQFFTETLADCFEIDIVTIGELIVMEDEQVPRDDVIAKFRKVDVERSACRNAEDKEKVVSIIESSYGELRLFDTMVRRGT